MNIRNATHQDREAVFHLAKALATSFKVENDPFIKSFQHHLECDSSLIAVACSGDNVVGYCLGYDHRAFYANGLVSWLEEVYVLEHYRKSGIGKKLMLHFEAWAKSRESKLVLLATRRSASFYKSIGYEPTAECFRKML